jgi:transposase
MELTAEQYEKIKDSLPVQRGNVRLQNLQVLNAILFVAEQGCKWRGLPSRFGKRHSVYTRMNRWSKNGVLDRVFEKLQLVAADARTAITFALSPGNAHDAPQGRLLLEQLGPMPEGMPMLMDRAYEGNETRQLVFDLGMIPVVPPKSNRLDPWEYDREMYKKRNEVERLFRRLKGFRRIFSRFEKLDVVFLGFLNFALIVEALRVV